MAKASMIGLVGLAMLAASVYFLLGVGILQAGDLQPDEAPPSIAFVAGTCYVVGGFLILARKRLLWIVGAIINALVIIVFIISYAARPSVLFSVPGLTIKAAQTILEIGLVYLIVTYKQGKR